MNLDYDFKFEIGNRKHLAKIACMVNKSFNLFS